MKKINLFVLWTLLLSLLWLVNIVSANYWSWENLKSENQTMYYSQNSWTNEYLLRQERSSQLRDNIWIRASAVDAIMNQWKLNENSMSNEDKLNDYQEKYERVERIRSYVDNMQISQEDRELYSNTFEYLSLQLQDCIEEIEE